MVVVVVIVVDGSFLQYDVGKLFLTSFTNHTTVHSLREGTPSTSGEGTGFVVRARGDGECSNITMVETSGGG